MAVPTSTTTAAADPAASKSSHVSDPALQPFLQPTFDPADYLNSTLPALSLSSVSARPLKQGQSVPLADLSSKTQDLLSQLNAHTTRLSTILTQLTDDILRSGGRLAYEVEVLRGETIGLSETLSETLKQDVQNFVPGGITLPATDNTNDDDNASETPNSETANILPETTTTTTTTTTTQLTESTPTTSPEYITQLRTLTLVRTRLETVIKIFGEAMHWTLPPSELSLTSSLISVSGPEPGIDSADREKRGKEFANALRSEISDLITGAGAGDLSSGVEAAETRIQALRDLAQVWKGTAEEKARIRFVEQLVKVAEEKQRAVGSAAASQRQRAGRSGSIQRQTQNTAPAPQKSGGFLDNLQRIRGNIYSE